MQYLDGAGHEMVASHTDIGRKDRKVGAQKLGNYMNWIAGWNTFKWNSVTDIVGNVTNSGYGVGINQICFCEVEEMFEKKKERKKKTFEPINRETQT